MYDSTLMVALVTKGITGVEPFRIVSEIRRTGDDGTGTSFLPNALSKGGRGGTQSLEGIDSLFLT